MPRDPAAHPLASAAEIFEAGFNHFFRRPSHGSSGDLVFLSDCIVPILSIETRTSVPSRPRST
jgi:pyruvate dehydrogenase complex dehydrogenase (E1) component